MGVVIAADGMLYVYAQDGKMYLAKPNAAAFEPVSQFAVSEGTNEHWAHPTIANGRLYVRHGDALVVYEPASRSRRALGPDHRRCFPLGHELRCEIRPRPV